MAGRFTARSQVGISVYRRTYPDTPAGHLRAARDKAADQARLHGHQMMHWSKSTRRERPAPYFTAYCGDCGAGIKVVTGRAPMNLPGYPKIVSFGQVKWCPGKTGRRW